MPIYEFSCSKCRKDFEVLVRSPSSPAECPSCGSRKVSKKFSTFAAHGVAKKVGGSSGCSKKSCSGCGGGCKCH